MNPPCYRLIFLLASLRSLFCFAFLYSRLRRSLTRSRFLLQFLAFSFLRCAQKQDTFKPGVAILKFLSTVTSKLQNLVFEDSAMNRFPQNRHVLARHP